MRGNGSFWYVSDFLGAHDALRLGDCLKLVTIKNWDFWSDQTNGYNLAVAYCLAI
jgi:hypothetical protein